MRLNLFLLAILSCQIAGSWGFSAHRSINYLACFKLPIELFPFYKQHIDEIEAWAVKADQRRYVVEDEGIGHYIDLDHYERSVPLDTVLRNWSEAVDSLGEDQTKKNGILPWRVMMVFAQLRDAFKTKDLELIVKKSADLGHYVADAHVPLHTTSNYDGQLTGQKGIHGLWETRLPELFAIDYDLLDGEAIYLDDPLEAIWGVIEDSYAAKDSVLRFERLISMDHTDAKYSFENRGSSVQKVYSRSFCKAYHQSLNNMVEIRMRKAISMVASFWYTAWIDAGQPELHMVDTGLNQETYEVDSVRLDSLLQNLPPREKIH